MDDLLFGIGPVEILIIAAILAMTVLPVIGVVVFLVFFRKRVNHPTPNQGRTPDSDAP